MGRRTAIIVLTAAAVFAVAAAAAAFGGAKIDYPAAVMVEDTLYTITNPPREVTVEEDEVVGTVRSYTKKLPKRNGQTNFDRSRTSRYAMVDGGVAVSYGERWYLFTAQ